MKTIEEIRHYLVGETDLMGDVIEAVLSELRERDEEIAAYNEGIQLAKRLHAETIKNLKGQIAELKQVVLEREIELEAKHFENAELKAKVKALQEILKKHNIR